MGPRQVLMTRIVWATVVPQKSRQSEAKRPNVIFLCGLKRS